MLSRQRAKTTAALVATIVGVFSLLTVSPAAAAGKVYPTWTVAGANPSWTGTMTMPAAGFPAATFATNSNTPNVPSGANTFLGPATPFGAAFGSSAGRQYLSFGAAAAQAPSTTTVTFASPTPATGWGFTIGDSDAESVVIQATGPGGPVAPSALGFQSTFNYCAAAPQPPGCTKAPFTDVPNWDPTTGTLNGNVNDTDGAAVWFRPTAPITTITFTLNRLSGIPIVQLWFASLTQDISGTVSLQTPSGPTPPPPGSVLSLKLPSGQPVTDPAGNPVTATPGPGGQYTFPGVAPNTYQVVVTPPPGYEVVGAATRDADASAGDIPGVDFLLCETPPPTTTTTTTTPPTPPPPTPAPTEAPAPGARPGTNTVPPGRRLPATGAGSSTLSSGLIGLGLLTVGALLLALSRRLRRA
ncbi:MAG TPA: LPXTG cell wall anchor domain-containing protein [Acidimicrobiales bacterium]